MVVVGEGVGATVGAEVASGELAPVDSGGTRVGMALRSICVFDVARLVGANVSLADLDPLQAETANSERRVKPAAAAFMVVSFRTPTVVVNAQPLGARRSAATEQIGTRLSIWRR